jgi:hypothetical protein
VVRFVKGKIKGIKIEGCRGLINESEDLVVFVLIKQERGSGSEVTIESSRTMMEMGSWGNGYMISAQT